MKRILVVLLALAVGSGTLYADYGRRNVRRHQGEQVLWRNPHIGILIIERFKKEAYDC